VDDIQVKMLENQENIIQGQESIMENVNQEILIQGQESIIEHVYEIVDIGSSVRNISDAQLEQLVLQTQIEYIMLCAILLGLGMWLFKWGVTLWKRWWR